MTVGLFARWRRKREPITTLAELRAYDEAGPRLVDWEGTGDPTKLPPPPKPPDFGEILRDVLLGWEGDDA